MNVNRHRDLQVGAAEEEDLVAVEPPAEVLNMVVVPVSEPLLDDMVLFAVECAMVEEFEYDCAEAAPTRPMAMVTKVFLIVMMG
jgi:hypothetical protein